MIATAMAAVIATMIATIMATVIATMIAIVGVAAEVGRGSASTGTCRPPEIRMAWAVLTN